MPVTRRGVTSLSKSGSAKLTGDTTLSEGTNITLTQSGNDIEIAASGGSGDVTAASNITDNAIVRGDGGAKGVQTSGIEISDTDVLAPILSDSGALGSASKMWSDLFLASGAVINFNNGNVTLTHAADSLTFAFASTSGNTMELQNVNAGTTGPYISLFHDSSTPGTSDQSGVEFNARNASATKVVQSAITGAWDSTTAGAENGRLRFYVTASGSIYQEKARLDAVAFRPGVTDGTQLGDSNGQWSDLFLASGAVINFNNGNATITHSAGLLTSSVDIAVPDEAYGAGWNGSTEVPTKNAVYDKIETLGASADLSVFEPAGQGFVTGTGVSLSNTTSSGQHITCISMNDGTNNQVWQVSTRVPAGANGLSISSIKLLFMNRAASVLNINGYFEVKKMSFSSGAAVTQDNTGTVTTFASPGTAGQTGVITAPADAFNGIGTVSTNDIIGIYFNRQGADAADTYGQTLEIIGMLITYA